MAGLTGEIKAYTTTGAAVNLASLANNKTWQFATSIRFVDACASPELIFAEGGGLPSLLFAKLAGDAIKDARISSLTANFTSGVRIEIGYGATTPEGL